MRVSPSDLARIQEARDKHETPAGPKVKKVKKAKEAKKTAGASDAYAAPKKRGRGRPRQSDEEEQHTVASEDEDEEEGVQSPQRKKVEEGGAGTQSVHGMSMRGSKKQHGFLFSG